jgi:hypothetical protein
MPGKFKRAPARRQQQSRLTVPGPRPVSTAVRRATNLNRLEQRVVRRQAARQVAAQIQNHPRPAVRPVQPPRLVMPSNQSPARAKAGFRTPSVTAGKQNIVSGRVPNVARSRQGGAAMAGAAAMGALVLNVANAHADISSEVSSLQWDLDKLKETSALTEVHSDTVNLDSALNNALDLLESARDKGYRFQSDLEDIAFQAMSQWEAVRPKILKTVERQSRDLQNRLGPLSSQVTRLNAILSNPSAAAPVLRSTHSMVNDLLREAERVQRDLENQYSQTESQAHELNRRLTQVHWALDQQAEAKFDMENGENLVMAVPARWDQEGKDDPEGVLYLTDKHLVFERKEKVATKKVLFITTASEMVQEVLISQPFNGIAAYKASNKGLFGHQDYLEVQFGDPQLGAVSFHLDGQDSTYWMSLLEAVQTGKIEGQRTAGSGLSIRDLSRPLNQSDIVALQNDVNELQNDAMLKGVREDLAQLENDVRSLERNLAAARAQGYALERNLEADVAILAAQWQRVRGNAESVLEQQTRLLGERMRSIQASLSRLAGMSGNLAAARPLYIQIKSASASLEAQADAAESTVLTQYDTYADEAESLTAHLEWIGWMLQAISTASFRLLATESGVAATEALWSAPGMEPENGILFLTDQRILWEDRVGTYELKVDVPLQQITDIKKESEPEADHESLAFAFASGTPMAAAQFQLALPVADSWLQMIGRARSGDYAQDRAVALDESDLERVRNAPRQCPNCGAALTTPILRGQNEITCEYCSVITRI